MADKTTAVYATSLRHDAVFSYRMDLATGGLTPIGTPIEVALPWKKLPVRNTDPNYEPTLPAERYARDRGYGCPWVMVQ